MRLLDKAAILAAVDLVVEEVPVPEWAPAGTPAAEIPGVRVKAMSAGEKDLYELSQMPDLAGLDPRDPDFLNKVKAKVENPRARLLVFCCVDEAGAPLFSEDDIGELSKKSAAAIDRIYAVAARLNGIGEQAKAALAKN